MRECKQVAVDLEMLSQRARELKDITTDINRYLDKCEEKAQTLRKIWQGEAANSLNSRLQDNHVAVGELQDTLRFGSEIFDIALQIYRESDQAAVDAIRAAAQG